MKPPARIPDNEWQPCKPGLIFEAKSSLAGELKETRRTALLRIAGIFGGGVLVAGVSMFAWRSPDKNPRRNFPAAIGCVQVHQQLAAYVGNQIADQDLRASIAMHLCKCVGCQRAFQDLRCKVDDACSRQKPCSCKT